MDIFLGFEIYPPHPRWEHKTPPVLGSPVFYPFPIVWLGYNLVYVFFSSMPIDNFLIFLLQVFFCWFSLKCSLIAAAASGVHTVGSGAFLGVVRFPVFTKFECHFLIDLFEGNFFLNLLVNFLIVVFIDRAASNCKVQNTRSSPVKAMSRNSSAISWLI